MRVLLMSMKKYSEIYYKNNGQSGDRIALGMYYRIVKRYIKKGSVLDYGAGNGFLSRRLSKTFKSFALEISEFARKGIKKNSPKTTIYKSDREIPNNAFSMCIALHCLEHVKKPKETLKLLSNSLLKGGYLFLVVPNIDGYGHKLKGSKWFGYKDITHISLLPSNKWKKYIENSGLKIVKTGSDWFWDPPYLPVIPAFLQKLFFYPGCLMMVLLGKIIFPEKFGEDLIIVARKN